MVPRLGPGQFVKGVLGEDGVKVAEVFWDVLIMVCQLGVLSEAFHKSLRDYSGCSNMLCLGKEPCCPNSVAFF